jgi:hypothetical protein
MNKEQVAVEAMVIAGLTPELASKNAESELVGFPAPPDPPLEYDQLAVFVPSQVPLPPTQ